MTGWTLYCSGATLLTMACLIEGGFVPGLLMAGVSLLLAGFIKAMADAEHM
jgi:hypothetical protein